MPLSAGSRVGVYEVIAPIGRGGMGEVYRARDSRLHREVAIKALPDAFSEDRDRLLRFEREARLLAALNHPNVAAIYGLEEQGASRLLVMELVEGPTLAERLASGPLPMEEALAVGLGIATGLEAAHEAGIIHRDLKPSNVKVRSDGTVKVLDLGLARVANPPSAAVDSSLSPTVTTPATHAGVVLGTAAYMSPEQARGKPLDKRTDVFSFGCVLYECLSGRQTFFGETVSDTLVAIITSEPDWSALPESTPHPVRERLRRCLQKDPKRRLHDIADARIELEDARIAGGSGAAVPIPAARPSRGRLAWGVGGALLGAAVAAAALLLLRRPRPQPAPTHVHAVLPLPPGDRFVVGRQSVTVSPDGRTVVYSATHQASRMLFRRDLDGARPEPIRGTEGGFSPFFSPDGQWIGFFTVDELKKVPLSGGTAVSLSPVPPVTAGGSWGEDGRIVFTPKFNGALAIISASGGEATALTQLDPSRGEHAHLYPQLLPGGRGLLFTVRRGRDFTEVAASDIAALDASTGKWKTILEGASFARYGAGRLVFLRGGSVFSVPFDDTRRSVTGLAAALSENVAVSGEEGFGQLDVSPGGTLVYVDGPPSTARTSTVLMLDRGGKEKALPLPPGDYMLPRFSPDGKRIALSRFAGMRGSIVLYERERNILSTLTPEPGTHFVTVWSPDGRRIAFSHFEEDMPVLSVKNADGSGKIEPLTGPGKGAEFPNAWSPDGKTILYTVVNIGDGAKQKLLPTDFWLVSPGDPRSARPWFESPFRETGGVFSPDGRWVAYVSDESGVQEVYVRPFPGPGASVKVSSGFAIEPLWSRDGRELYYRAGARAERFMAAEIQTAAGLSISPPRLLFSSELAVGAREDQYRQYDVSADGREFVSHRYDNLEEVDRYLTIVTDWAATPGP